MKIIPMRDLKNTVELERICAEENGPVFVTKNGYGRLVVMDIDYFNRVFGKYYEAELAFMGLKDEKAERFADLQTAPEDTKNEVGF